MSILHFADASRIGDPGYPLRESVQQLRGSLARSGRPYLFLSGTGDFSPWVPVTRYGAPDGLRKCALCGNQKIRLGERSPQVPSDAGPDRSFWGLPSLRNVLNLVLRGASFPARGSRSPGTQFLRTREPSSTWVHLSESPSPMEPYDTLGFSLILFVPSSGTSLLAPGQMNDVESNRNSSCHGTKTRSKGM